MKLFNRNKKNSGINRQSGVLFFHEDYYRQIELIPVENYFERKKIIDKDINKSHASEFGFEECILRKEQAVSTSSKKITIEDFNNLMSPLAYNFFSIIESGYGSTHYSLENTVAWGFDTYGIFAETDDKGIVQNIYLCHNGKFDDKKVGISLSKAIVTLGKSYDLLLVDWNKEILINIQLPKTTNEYLTTILELKIST